MAKDIMFGINIPLYEAAFEAVFFKKNIKICTYADPLVTAYIFLYYLFSVHISSTCDLSQWHINAHIYIKKKEEYVAPEVSLYFSLTTIQLLIWEAPSSRVKANMTDNTEGAAA